MRHCLLRQREPAGDGLAHGVHGLEVVAALRIEREDFRIAHAARHGRAGSGGAPNTGGDGGLHVRLDDAPARPGAGNQRQVDAVLLRQPLRQRRGEHAARRTWRGGRGWRGPWCRCGGGLLRRGLRLRRLRLRLLRLGCGLRARRGQRGGIDLRHLRHILAVLGQHGDDGVHRHTLRALRHDDLRQHPLVGGLQLHDRLVRLDLGDHVAGVHLLAFLLQPAGDLALGHGGRERRHENGNGHR